MQMFALYSSCIYRPSSIFFTFPQDCFSSITYFLTSTESALEFILVFCRLSRSCFQFSIRLAPLIRSRFAFRNPKCLLPTQKTFVIVAGSAYMCLHISCRQSTMGNLPPFFGQNLFYESRSMRKIILNVCMYALTNVQFWILEINIEGATTKKSAVALRKYVCLKRTKHFFLILQNEFYSVWFV